jgi:hypothetical protein
MITLIVYNLTQWIKTKGKQMVRCYDYSFEYLVLACDRYVVHDVVSQYPALNSIGIGDHDERHVVIYRIDSPPEHLLMHIQAKDMQVRRVTLDDVQSPIFADYLHRVEATTCHHKAGHWNSSHAYRTTAGTCTHESGTGEVLCCYLW